MMPTHFFQPVDALVAVQSHMGDRSEQDAAFTKFLDEIRKALPGVHVARSSGTKADLYYPEDFCSFMRVSYRDVRAKITEEAKRTYNVYSRTIENKKFASWRDEHRSISSNDMSKALAAVKRYAARPAPEEVMKFSRGKFTDAVRDLDNDYDNPVRVARSNLGIGSNGTPLLDELRRLHEEGVPFRDAKVAEYVGAYVAAKKEFDENRIPNGTPIVFVEIRGDGDLAVAHVISTTAVVKSWSSLSLASGDTAVMPLAELPDDLQGRLSVLSIMPPRQYAVRVGMRLSDRVFYAVL